MNATIRARAAISLTRRCAITMNGLVSQRSLFA
jgi:hypothetical protein